MPPSLRPDRRWSRGDARRGINNLLYFDLRTGRAYEYRYPPEQKTWLAGSDLCYTKDFWRSHRFADINIGMDGLFAWSASRQSISVLADSSFAVHMIHDQNGSAKQVANSLWRPHPVENIEKVMGQDWVYYRHENDLSSSRPRPRAGANGATPTSEAFSSAATPIRQTAPLRNVFACLVHEKPECVIDLVQNLRRLDDTSRILLYDGGGGGALLDKRLPWLRWGVEIHPRPRPMKWGQLHGFALDCLRYLKSSEPFDVMTVVDSDQLAVRPGYSEFLANRLGDRTGLGLLSNAPERQGPNTRISPCLAAHKEAGLWRPLLRRFPGGEDKFVHWTFWPSTAITADAGLALLDLFDKDRELSRILGASGLWATEDEERGRR